MSPVCWVGRRPFTPVGKSGSESRPGRRRCCRTRRSPHDRRSHRRLGALEDDVLVGQRESRAGRTAPGGPGTPRGTACRSRAGRRSSARYAAIFGWSCSRGSPGPGPTTTRSTSSKAPSTPCSSSVSWRTTREPMPSTREHVARACSRSRPRRATIAIVRPASVGAGGAPAWSVSQNFASRWLRRVQRDQHVLVLGEVGDRGRRTRGSGTSPNADRMPPALASVSATS